MAYNGSGAFTIDTAGNPVSSGTTIDPSVHNTTLTEIATGLTNAICKDGQTTLTQNIPFNNKKITGLAAATARTDGASLATIQDGTGVYVATVGGTADVITLTPSPAITAYAAGQVFQFIPSGANTTNVTVNVSGLGAKAITKNGTTALVANDILASMMVRITYDGTRFILGTHLTADAVTLAGTQTLTNKTITNPVLSGSATGTYTLAGTPTIANASLQACSVTAPGVAALGVAANSQLTWVIHGLTYQNNGADATNDIDLAAGGCIDATGTYWMVRAALTKRSDASWAVGTNQGWLDTGVIGDNTYYEWTIARSDTGVVDSLLSLSATAPTMPANYSYKRLTGYVLRSGGTIVAFSTYELPGGGLDFAWASPTVDVALAGMLTTSRRTDALKVPLNFSVVAHVNIALDDAVAGNVAYITCPDTTDVAPSPTTAPLATLRVQVGGNNEHQDRWIRTGATGLIASRADVATMDNYRVATLGFHWARRN